MAMIQQELKPQTTEVAGDDADELYEEGPPRRPWATIASVVLALAVFFVGYQWNQAASRAELLASQIGSVRAEAETQRLRAEDAQRQVDGLQKRLQALTTEKDALGERVAALEKGAQPKQVAAREISRERPPAGKAVVKAPARPHAVPVVAKKTAAR